MRRHLYLKAIICISVILILSTIAVYGADIFDRLQDAKAEFEELTKNLNPESIISIITANLTSSAKSTLLYFAGAIGVILISAVFSSISAGSGSQNIFELVSGCCIICSIFPSIIICFEKVQEHIEAVCGFMLSFIPVGAALHASSGCSLSASLLSTMGTGSISILQVTCAGMILPLTKASCSIIAANSLCKKVNLSGIFSLIKSVSLWIIGLYFTIFTGILTLSTVLQASADNLAIKGIKYGAAKLIPIAGGLVSESMKTLIASASFIKSTTGISGIIFIIYALIPPLCLLLLTKFELCLLSAFSKTVTSGGISSFLDALGSCMNILLALLISCSLAFIIMLAIFMKTNVTI